MSEETDWLEGESEAVPTKGELFTKSRLTNLLGYAPMTVDRFVKEGMPVEARGSRKLGWRINSAAAHHWIVGHKVQQATGSSEAQGFDAAKTREKAAAAKLKEISIEQQMGRLVPADQVTAVYQDELTTLRSRLLAIPSRIGNDAVVQEMVRIEILDALSDLTGTTKAKRDDHVE